MAYNLIYFLEFDSIAEVTYRLDIYKKDYEGVSTEVKGSGVPVMHRWDTDDPKAPIHGSSLTAKLLNVDDALPLLNFYSISDDTFKGVFTNVTQNKVLFTGFLVQEDCIEDMLDYTHEIELNFTDNLGLLKETTFDKVISASVNVTSIPVNIGPLAPNKILFSGIAVPAIKPGDKIIITGTTFNATYTAASAIQSGTSNEVVTVEAQTTVPVEAGIVTIQRVYDDYDKITLFAILHAILKFTGAELPLTIFANLYEENTSSEADLFRQTLINKYSFISGDNDYKDCYYILEKILGRLNCSLFQSEGKWIIIRWDEAAYLTPFNGYVFNSDFIYTGTTVYENFITAGIGELTVAATGLNKRIARPYEFTKETFNYDVPKLLRNGDLQELGSLITSYTVNEETYNPGEDADGTNDYTVTYYEYYAPHWFTNDLGGASADWFIRIVKDEFDNEIQRYLVVKDNNIKSTTIEANQGDKINFNFQTRNAGGAVGVPSTLILVVKITDGSRTLYADEYGIWKISPGYSYQSQNDYADFTSVEVETGRLPFDGLLTVYLTLINGETHFNDLRFEYIAYINESTKITGQKHSTSQTLAIKNNLDVELEVDDSPRNFISGTLFTPNKTGLIQQRTRLWNGPNLSTITTGVCKLYTFGVFGSDISTYGITGTACNGTAINVTGFVGDGTPPPICARSIQVTGNVIVTGNEADCGTYQIESGNTFSLGKIVGYETLQWRYGPRTILEGTFYGLIQGELNVSLNALFTYTFTEGLRYVPGRLEIDYRNNSYTATLWELYDTPDTYTDLVNQYKFSYIYTN